SYTINLRNALGADTAYAGFTGGTGGQTARIAIESWASNFNPVAAPPPPQGQNVTPPAPPAGEAFPFTPTQRPAFGQTVGSYRGPVQFSSSDPRAMLQRSYTFTASDAGSHTFAANLLTAGRQTITVTDSTGLTDTFSVVVTPAATSGVVVSGYPS